MGDHSAAGAVEPGLNPPDKIRPNFSNPLASFFKWLMT
jgi:hypothetical protein